jgi:hypothetical protein
MAGVENVIQKGSGVMKQHVSSVLFLCRVDRVEIGNFIGRLDGVRQFDCYSSIIGL